MVPIISLFSVVVLSVVVTRVASIALSHTGLSSESARFQARSAFTGAGFTTDESERVVNHPVRRRIILLLMLLGNAGIVTAVSSLILTFVGPDDVGGLGVKVLFLVGGLVGLFALANSEIVDRKLSRVVQWALHRYSDLDIRDYASLMQLGEGYRIAELRVQPDDWLAGRTLRAAELWEEEVLVLGVNREGGDYVGAPRGDLRIAEGDTLLLYGHGDALEELDTRTRDRGGDLRHREAKRRVARAENAV